MSSGTVMDDANPELVRVWADLTSWGASEPRGKGGNGVSKDELA